MCNKLYTGSAENQAEHSNDILCSCFSFVIMFALCEFIYAYIVYKRDYIILPNLFSYINRWIVCLLQFYIVYTGCLGKELVCNQFVTTVGYHTLSLTSPKFSVIQATISLCWKKLLQWYIITKLLLVNWIKYGSGYLSLQNEFSTITVTSLCHKYWERTI